MLKEFPEYFPVDHPEHKITRGISTVSAVDEAGAMISARCSARYAIRLRDCLADMQAIDPNWTLSLMIRRALVLGVKMMLANRERVAKKWSRKNVE